MLIFNVDQLLAAAPSLIKARVPVTITTNYLCD